jgi:hypothetical protein
LSDRGGENLPEVAGHGGTRLGGGLDDGRPKGRRRKAMDMLERVLGVARSQGFSWLTRGGLEVPTRGGLVTASTAAQWRQKGGGGRYSTGECSPL